MMSPQVKGGRRLSGNAVGLLVFLSTTNSVLPQTFRPFAGCAFISIPADTYLPFILNLE